MERPAPKMREDGQGGQVVLTAGGGFTVIVVMAGRGSAHPDRAMPELRRSRRMPL